MIPASHQTVESIICGSGGSCSVMRFEALQESHTYIKLSWMCPLLGWLQSCTHLQLPSLLNVNKGAEKRREAEEEGSKI